MAGSEEHKQRLLSALKPKLQAKLGFLAFKLSWLIAKHCERLLQQIEQR